MSRALLAGSLAALAACPAGDDGTAATTDAGSTTGTAATTDTPTTGTTGDVGTTEGSTTVHPFVLEPG